jgi:hypothetical protein
MPSVRVSPQDEPLPLPQEVLGPEAEITRSQQVFTYNNIVGFDMGTHDGP